MRIAVSVFGREVLAACVTRDNNVAVSSSAEAAQAADRQRAGRRV
jgi:hypothetical protein